jgi:hypothetical protein
VISAGSLIVNGSLASASAVTVQYGGSLGGIGSVGAVTVNSGACITPGDTAGAIGSLTLGGNLSLGSGAILAFDLGPASASDKIAMSSFLLSLSNQQFSDFVFTTHADFGPGVYSLIDAGSIQGCLSGNLSGTIGNRDASISISGSNLILTVVPEPSTLALFGIAAGLSLLGLKWKRRFAG